jgi:hypothetical protein
MVGIDDETANQKPHDYCLLGAFIPMDIYRSEDEGCD